MVTLTAADDELHEWPQDSRWAETAWFAAHSRERGIGVWLYPLFRPSLGVMSLGIYVWAPDGRELWQQPYSRLFWHMPVPAEFRLSTFSLPSGLRYRSVTPLRSYEAGYSDGHGTSIELSFEAIHEPHVVPIASGSTHYDQLGRVRGELCLKGERIPIDCIEMRDRTWSIRAERREGTHPSSSYCYCAVDDGSAFLLTSRIQPDLTRRFLYGYVASDGAVTRQASGVRRVQRDAAGRPSRIEATCIAPDGTMLQAVAEVVSQTALNTSPYFVWVSLLRWQLDDGRVGWGEDQEAWWPSVAPACFAAWR